MKHMIRPTVSVIMATKNPNSGRLRTSIHSILNQTMKNFELIVIDDGSSEVMRKEIKNVCKIDSRIRLIRNKKNIGLAASLNRGIDVSMGMYIARMDDDDISLPNRFQEQVCFLEKYPNIAFVGCNAIKFGVTENDGLICLQNSPKEKDFLWNSPFLHPSIMFRRVALLAIGGYRIAKETRRAEDYDLFMRLYSMGYRGANIQKPLFKYFVDINSMKKKRKYKYRIDELKIRSYGFKILNLPIYKYLFVIKPIVVGLIPQKAIYKMHKIQKK